MVVLEGDDMWDRILENNRLLFMAFSTFDTKHAVFGCGSG